MVSPHKPLAVAIMGPTASGKTAAALAIAQHIPCEIISVDSALIYQEMDIGSAKPSAEELASVPHHLIDILPPTASYSAMQFRDDATALIQDIQQRGKLPLLVGGTMLYFKTLKEGLDELPTANPAIRAQLDKEAEEIGVPGLHARLMTLDPVTGERLKPNDSQRIQRALEVIMITGKPMSSLFTDRKNSPELPFELLQLALEPSDRKVLHDKIALRFDMMLADHQFENEVKRLRARGDLHLGLPSMRCVGYRQMWEYLDGDYDFATMREKGIIATRQLAKRQLTWLRAIPERIVIDSNQPDAAQQVLQHVQQQLAS